MISRHRKYKFFTTMVIALFLCIPYAVLGLAPAPVDYLVPPPPPPAALTRLNHARPKNLLATESRTIPQYVNTQQQTLVKPIDPQQQQQPGIMTRVARWFGFANQNLAQEQGIAATNKQAYYYPKPQQQGDKEPCNLCNKYPWVPMMMPNGIHYSGNQWDPAKAKANIQQLQNSYGLPLQGQQMQNLYGPTQQGQQQQQVQHAASNVKQRAVQFNFPHPNLYQVPNNVKDNPLKQIQYSTGPFLPIPIPNLSLNNQVMPPLYNAQPFHPPKTPLPANTQQLPSTEPAHFGENIGEHSEIHADTVIPTQIPPTTQLKDSSFEIIQSHQLVDYVSSIEYPASFVQSHSFDVSSEGPSTSGNQKTDTKISTGLYQHATFSPHLNQHIPASQILTELGSFRTGEQQQQPQQQSTQQSEIYEQTTTFNQPQYLEHVQHYDYDNYVAASQHNSSVFESQRETHQDAWTLESNDYLYSTSSPATDSTTFTEMETTITTELESTTEPQQQDNEVEFVASVQTGNQRNKIESSRLWPKRTKQRETPKRLLDSPIQHLNGNLGSPRPFTRDPSDLGFRLGAKNHKFSESTSTHEPWKPQTVSPASPTPTSTYISIDASGQYAGMSPPALPSNNNKQKQILVPYLTTKNRPRPFESTRDNAVTKSPSTSGFSTWTQNQSSELHTPQESMLVKSHIRPSTSTTTARPRTTKYLTKILASNLRQLLQREHEPTKLKLSPNSLDIDLNKLQQNIDDWTEQEYTSLSHRPSTPTIRGRSKHIPFEYLPTTTAAVRSTRKSKTTKGFTDTSELPSSINNLEPLYERESTKHFQYAHITDNHLQDFYDNFEALKSRTTTKPTTTMYTTTTTTEKPLYLRPVLTQEPEELWKKAKVSISPQTQEKVYVVTPQPRFFPQRLYSPTVPTTTEKSFSFVGSGFKSPRFLVRPTPGNANNLLKISGTDSKENSKENLSNSYFSPEWFGLRGLSTYVPAEPVEINDGNSKVLTIVTPPSNLETTTPAHNIMDLTRDRHSLHKRKSTMSPSPR